MSRAYYIESPDVDVSLDEALALGVLRWKLDVNNYESDLNAIKLERGYNYQDVVESSKIPDFEKKVAIFAHEHMHDDEEIRFCLDGSGFFDVRDQRNGDDKWLRIVFQAGDMLVLPAGIYHRFVVDEKGFFKVLRLFCGDPVWTPHNRDAAGTDERPARTKAFEEQRDNFKKLHKVYQSVDRDLSKYDASLKAINTSLLMLGTSFESLYDGNTDSDGARFKSATLQIDSASARFNSDQDAVRAELAAYLAQLDEFKKRIAERDDALVLGDAAAEALDKLRDSKKEVTDAKLKKFEEDADQARDKYVEINTRLGQDLSELFARRCDDFDAKLKAIVAAEVALFSAVADAYQSIADADTRAHADRPAEPEWAAKKYDTKKPAAKAPAPAAAAEHNDNDDSDDGDAAWNKQVADSAPPAPLKKPAAGKDLDAKKAGVGSAAAKAMLKGNDPLDDDAVQAAAGSYVASAAMNEEMQEKAGKAVANKARDKDAQAKAGAAIAANTDNPLLKAAAGNKMVQGAAGSALGAVASNKKAQQAAGKAIADKANDKESQQKAAGALKGFMKK